MQATKHVKTAAGPLRPAQAVAAEIGEPLARLIERYEAFVGVLEDHRAAIGRADGRAIDGAIVREDELLRELLDLDARCRAALGQDGRNAPESGWTLTRLGGALGGEAGDRLSETAAYLKTLTGRAELLQRGVREASRAMASHIDGLVRQVSQRLSHAGTYGAAGRVESGAPVVSGLDVSL